MAPASAGSRIAVALALEPAQFRPLACRLRARRSHRLLLLALLCRLPHALGLLLALGIVLALAGDGLALRRERADRGLALAPLVVLGHALFALALKLETRLLRLGLGLFNRFLGLSFGD